MIYTVTLNPSLDYYLHVDELNVGETNRSLKERISFGGKGLNVSAVLSVLGIENTALGFIGGFTGDALVTGLENSNIKTDFVRLSDGLTRINVKVKSGNETELNAAGPKITDAALRLLFEKLEALNDGDTLVLAGSVPLSLPDTVYEDILSLLLGKDIRVAVDASGRLLLNALRFKPFLVKPNLSELEELVGKRLFGDRQIADAARTLKARGAENVLVSLGGDGALLVDKFDTEHRVKAHCIKPVNTVGAGDSMVAGFLAGVDKGFDYALWLSNIVGAATAASEGLADRKGIMTLAKDGCDDIFRDFV